MLDADGVALYRALFARGPATISELLTAGQVGPGFVRMMRELASRGLVGETGARLCRATGRPAITWDVVGGLRRGIDLRNDDGGERPRQSAM